MLSSVFWDTSDIDGDLEWASSVERSLEACLSIRDEELDHDVLCVLVEKLIGHDFYYAREVRGVSLTQKAHAQMEFDRDEGIEYQPRCDFLLRPKERLIGMGFPDMYLCIEVKHYPNIGVGKTALFNEAIAQSIDYNNSVFFLSKHHADTQGNLLLDEEKKPLAPGAAIRPAYTFVFYNGKHFLTRREPEWPFNVSCQCHVGLLSVVRDRRSKSEKYGGVGWRFDLASHALFAQGSVLASTPVGSGAFALRYSSLPQTRSVASGRRPLLPPVGDHLKHNVPYKDRWVGSYDAGRLEK